MTAYEAFAGTDDGRRRLSRSRLRYRVLEVLHESLERSGLTKAELARNLGIRKSAVSQVFGGDGNLRVNTIADYLDGLGAELEVRLVPRAVPRVKGGGGSPDLTGLRGEARPLQPIENGGRMRPEAVRANGGDVWVRMGTGVDG